MAFIREAIYEAYRRMGYKNSDGRAEAMIDVWCWMWEDSECACLVNIEARSDNGTDDLDDIYGTLKTVRGCFIDQELDLYESFDELVEASDQFHHILGQIIFRGYLKSPWLPEYELQAVSCTSY